MSRELVVRPIGFVHSPFNEKVEAPRQAVMNDTPGQVELLPEYRDCLSDLEGFDRIWLLFWFDRAEGWRPKVQPPRSDEKRGVFATRSPHRPNPIGLSAVRLERVEGLTLHIRDLDLVEGTPVLDIKPYIPYADAFPDVSAGWLDAKDPKPPWTVTLDAKVEEALAWIAEETGLDFRERIVAALGLGPQPHAYRRIKERPDGTSVLAVKDWRAVFVADDPGRSITVVRIESGYRPKEIRSGQEPAHAVHRAFVERFG